jgi:hypothetical protein
MSTQDQAPLAVVDESSRQWSQIPKPKYEEFAAVLQLHDNNKELLM